MINSICVFCSASPNILESYIQPVENLGKEIASRGFELVYGGGSTGLMGVISSSVKLNQGKVYGVIPSKLNTREKVSEICDELLVATDMRERKKYMELRADAFIVLPGGSWNIRRIYRNNNFKATRVP